MPVSVWPAPSSAVRITPTWPSIIPLGPTSATPAAACASAISAYTSRVASLSTRPSSVSRPQCPWSVNSSRHRSLITVSVSPTSATTSAIATLRMPSGSRAPEPVASLRSGMPKSIRPPSPRSAASAAAFTNDSRLCWTTPGIDEIGRGSVSPSRTNTGSTSRRASTEVSATSRRRDGVRRNRRGRTTGPCAMATSSSPDDARPACGRRAW